MNDKVVIRRFPTGVPGLDVVMGGGLPEFSFNLIAGAPGSGKTTLVQQIMFSLATPDRPALCFTVLGEPPLKMLRYQQQFAFFDMAKVNDSIRFVSLAEEVANNSLDKVLERITHEVEALSPGIVVVDSFRSFMRASKRVPSDELLSQLFVQQLAIRLTGWQATTFLVGEYLSSEVEVNPVFTIADGLLWLYQSIDRNSMVRKIQVMKLRGQAAIPGLHTFRITDKGLDVFPRLIIGSETAQPSEPSIDTPAPLKRLSIGVKGLDEMLGGGIPAGYSILVAGPSGSGKTSLSTEFLAEGVRQGENGVVAVFEKRPGAYALSARSGQGFQRMVREGQIKLIQTRPLDLSIDETLYDLTHAIHQVKARRLVVDSLSGFELALAPTFRQDFRESLYRMVAALTGMGVTVMLTAELEDRYTDLRFSPHDTAFLTDAIILQRYVMLQGELRRIMGVVKLRASAHSKQMRAFEITHDAIVMGEALRGYEGLLTGNPVSMEGIKD
jgi:circadian clock protein KaiC